MGNAGLDIRDYPGDNIMQWLINNTNLEWTGFYLAPSPCQGNTSWMNKYNVLKNFGWGFAPLYVGQQDPATTSCPSSAHVLTQAQGITDAIEAANLATQAGFPSGSVIYLDVEQGGLLSQSFMSYITAWIDELSNNQSYVPGIYCSYKQTADQINAIRSNLIFWVYRLGIYTCPNSSTNTYPDPDPSNSGISYASAWQLIQECDIDAGGTIIRVDLDSASSNDPSLFSSSFPLHKQEI